MLSKVVDYAILEGQQNQQLIDEVKESMKDGWVPSGPLLISGGKLLQVMVKFEQIDSSGGSN
jgi:hypothetical protein